MANYQTGFLVGDSLKGKSRSARILTCCEDFLAAPYDSLRNPLQLFPRQMGVIHPFSLRHENSFAKSLCCKLIPLAVFSLKLTDDELHSVMGQLQALFVVRALYTHEPDIGTRIRKCIGGKIQESERPRPDPLQCWMAWAERARSEGLRARHRRLPRRIPSSSNLESIVVGARDGCRQNYLPTDGCHAEETRVPLAELQPYPAVCFALASLGNGLLAQGDEAQGCKTPRFADYFASVGGLVYGFRAGHPFPNGPSNLKTPGYMWFGLSTPSHPTNAKHRHPTRASEDTTTCVYGCEPGLLVVFDFKKNGRAALQHIAILLSVFCLLDNLPYRCRGPSCNLRIRWARHGWTFARSTR